MTKANHAQNKSTRHQKLWSIARKNVSEFLPDEKWSVWERSHTKPLRWTLRYKFETETVEIRVAREKYTEKFRKNC